MGDVHPAEITALLGRVREGDVAARDELLPLVYKDLEAIARGYVNAAQSLEPRGLVHELYLKIVASPIDARDRKHFFAIAALAMRQILTDRARRRRANKRGGEQVQVTLTGLAEAGTDRAGACSDVKIDELAIDDALGKLEKLSPRQARIVEMRCLVGLSVPETAEALDLSERTVHNEWRLARAWLSRELGGA